MIRSRYCPSPSGFSNVGGTRTALFAYAYCKKNGGKFHLRIEDTNAETCDNKYLIDIMKGMEFLGIKWDFGPSLEDVQKGIFKKEHFQSLQGDIFDHYVEKLLSEGKAYENEDKSVSFRMPKEKYVLDDMIVGRVQFPKSEQKDFIIRRSDGTIIFHASNVISDAIEEMTMLCKGADHISNYPKHAALFQAFGFKLPLFAHLPLILDAQGEKLSKRRSDQMANLSDLKKDGFLSEAIVHSMCSLGWSPPEKKELLTLEYICEALDLDHCSRQSPRHDPVKLRKTNSDLLKKMPIDQFSKRVIEFGQEFYPEVLAKIESSGLFGKFIEAYHSRSETLAYPYINANQLLWDHSQPTDEDSQKVIHKNNNEGLKALEMLHENLARIDNWTKENLLGQITQINKSTGLSMNKLCQPLRLGLTGRLVTPPIDQTLEILGKEKSIERIKKSLGHFTAKLNLNEKVAI